jgi:uncharacterized protein DUF4232
MRSSTAPVLRPVPNRSLGRGARATLAMGLVPILAAGCGAASSAGSRQSTARQTASTEVADSTLTGGAAPRCHTSELGASTLNSTGAAGTIGGTFRLANTSQRACRLAGFVGMQMLDVAGRPLSTRVMRNGGFLSTHPGAERFSLPPGDAATFELLYGTVPTGSETCVRASRLLVTPPDETASLEVAATLGPVCRGGELDVSPLRPRCHTSQLRLRYVGGDGGAGTQRIRLGMANASAVSCTVLGFPGIAMLDAGGKVLPTHTVRSGGPFSSLGAPTLFLLMPGKESTLGVAYSHVARSASDCSRAAQLTVTPPDERDHQAVNLPSPDSVCNGGELDVSPALAPGASAP